MSTIQDIQAKEAATAASLVTLTDAVTSMVTLAQGDSAMIASLRQQLADAIAAGGSTAGLQAIADGLDSLKARIDANAATLAAAVTSNTPA